MKNFENADILRTVPDSLEEMMDWGMINKWVYDKVKHLPFDEAKEIIDSEYGIQSWQFQKSHMVELMYRSDVTPLTFSKEDFIRLVLQITQGRTDPNVFSNMYDEHKTYRKKCGLKSYKRKLKNIEEW